MRAPEPATRTGCAGKSCPCPACRRSWRYEFAPPSAGRGRRLDAGPHALAHLLLSGRTDDDLVDAPDRVREGAVGIARERRAVVMIGGRDHVPVVLRTHLGAARGVLDHHQRNLRHRVQRGLRSLQRGLVGIREDQEHASGDGLPHDSEMPLDVKRSVHLRYPVELPAERFDRLLVAVAEALDDCAFDVDRLLGKLGRQGVEHAGLGVRDGALADTQDHALGELLQLAIHHLDDEPGAAVGGLLRADLTLQGRLARWRGGRTPEPLGLHRRFQRPSPVDARHQHPRQPAAERLGVVVLDGDAVDFELRHGIPRCVRVRQCTTTRTIPPWSRIRQIRTRPLRRDLLASQPLALVIRHLAPPVIPALAGK